MSKSQELEAYAVYAPGDALQLALREIDRLEAENSTLQETNRQLQLALNEANRLLSQIWPIAVCTIGV